MREIRIIERFSIAEQHTKLSFGDGLPVVVAYIRTDRGDGHHSRVTQTIAIKEMLERRFGSDGCNIIWVIENASRNTPFFDPESRTCREGLYFTAEVLRCGYSAILAASSLDRLTGNLQDWLKFSYYVLARYGIQLTLADEPDPKLWDAFDPARQGSKTQDPRSKDVDVNNKRLRPVMFIKSIIRETQHRRTHIS